MRKKLRKEKSRGNWVRENNGNVKKGDKRRETTTKVYVETQGKIRTLSS